MSTRLLAATLVTLAALAVSASAEKAWVRGASLNLRSGAGREQSVLGSLAPGEPVEVIGESGEWLEVRREDGSEGYIAARYVSRDAPPEARIHELEGEVERLRDELAGAAREADDARQRGEEAAGLHAERAAEIERMRRENEALRAGARWPEWITGALILSTGMALGAALRGVSGRRRQARLRL
jgi:uncharacterized protein YgiM (DUF1202 family)